MTLLIALLRCYTAISTNRCIHLHVNVSYDFSYSGGVAAHYRRQRSSVGSWCSWRELACRAAGQGAVRETANNPAVNMCYFLELFV